MVNIVVLSVYLRSVSLLIRNLLPSQSTMVEEGEKGVGGVFVVGVSLDGQEMRNEK